MSADTVTVALQTSQFEEALASHLDQTKPDPLSRRQVEALALHWDEMKSDEAADGNDGSSSEHALNEARFNASTDETTALLRGRTFERENAQGKETTRVSKPSLICGALTLWGEYVSVSIAAECRWTWESDRRELCKETGVKGDDDQVHTRHSNKEGSGTLHFLLFASASFTTRSQVKRRQQQKDGRDNGRRATEKKSADVLSRPKDFAEGNGDEPPPIATSCRKEQRAATEARAGIIDRMRSDPYICRLLEANKETVTDEKIRGATTLRLKKNNKKASSRTFLCEAVIQQGVLSNEEEVLTVEERVDVSEDAVEGIRRAILSQMENISVMDLLLSMPYLPRSSMVVATADSASGSKIGLCPLGDRAYLRLLEDAMFDACEKEGEDELIDDLDISDGGIQREGLHDETRGTTPSTRAGRNESSMFKRHKPTR